MTDLRRSCDSRAMTSNTLHHRALAASFGQAGAELVVPNLSEIYEANFKYVWRCLRGLGVTGAALDDAVQEVFLVVQRKLAGFDGACNIRTWLYAIVLRIARRHRAESAREARRFLTGDHVAPLELPGEGATKADLRQEVEENEQLALARQALGLLDDPKREVFVLSCVEGMSAPEIARLTGVPLNTVYSRLRAARQAFAEAVSRLSSPTPPGEQDV